MKFAAEQKDLQEGILECLHRRDLMTFKAPTELFVPEAAFSKFVKDQTINEHDVANMLDTLNSWYRKWPELRELEDALNYLAIRQHGVAWFKPMPLVADTARTTTRLKRSRKEYEG